MTATHKHEVAVEAQGIGIIVNVTSERSGSNSDENTITFRGTDGFQNDYSLTTSFYGNLERAAMALALRKAADLLEMDY